jgi:hypothetical protein
LTETPTIFVALNNVKSAIGAVRKQEKNQMQNFLFRGVDAVVNAAAPELNKHGVIVTPEVLDYSYEVAEFGSKRTLMGHVQVKVKYTFWGPAGDFVSSTVFAESTDSGDKAAAKAMSVAYRIALLQTLNLPTDEPDPDEQSYERSQPVTQTVTKPARAAVKKVTVPWVDKANGDADWEATIAKVETTDQLNEVWKKAGELGTLPAIKDALFKRDEELKLTKSA